ncbi:hypothetical protein [Lactiplantibacillus plajomi]|uniref:Uncharacterized protein n=1 Tax=Lactiplantibacillus plajomi TaxID=1457217 RepID=A0ABV6K0W3_9LACO|nr:hypothetical protein [Lactiplantibacillus plajomi]
MVVMELLKHEDWYTFDENDNLILTDNPTPEAQKAYQEYLDYLKFEDASEFDF